MLIDTSDLKTFPVIIEQAVIKYVNSLPEYVLKKIIDHPIQSSRDVRCAIEDYMTQYKAESLYQEILHALEQCSFIAFHATRLISLDYIKTNGIKTIEWSWYSNMLSQYLNCCGISADDVNKALDLIKHEYDRKCEKHKPICFFLHSCFLIGKVHLVTINFVKTLVGSW